MFHEGGWGLFLDDPVAIGASVSRTGRTTTHILGVVCDASGVMRQDGGNNISSGALTYDDLQPMTRRHLLLIAIVSEGSLVLLAWGLGAVVGTPAFDLLHLSWAATGFGLLASVPMLGVLAWVIRTQWPPLVRFQGTIDEVVTPLFANCTMMDLVVISALAGLGEEVLFRGVMQTALAGAVGLWLAVALTSIVFGLAHFISVTYAVYATVVGVYLGVLLIVFGNLLVPVVAHAVYDFLALVYLVYFRPPADGFDPRGALSEPLA